MKKICIALFALASYFSSSAQVADGTTVPDFTFKDINGNTQNLYTYLNQNKYVVIDASATWCGPCWNFHHTAKTLEHLYTDRDVVGDNTARVLFLEADVQTTLADLQGTGTNTQGDWVTGTPYPIMNPGTAPQSGETSFSAFDNAYQIPWYPAFYVICPNKKVWTDTLNNYQKYPWPPSQATFEYLGKVKCAVAAGLDELTDAHPMAVYPNPTLGKTNFSFMLNSASNVKMIVSNIMGAQVDVVDFGKLNAGDNKLVYDTKNLGSGNYYLQFIIDNGRIYRTKLMVE
jgi:thiol-disulfide isomerase/thioredoxin